MVSAQDGPEFQVVFPKIDISNFETRKEQISKELGEAAREIGFFYITGKSYWTQHFQNLP